MQESAQSELVPSDDPFGGLFTDSSESDSYRRSKSGFFHDVQTSYFATFSSLPAEWQQPESEDGFGFGFSGF